MSEKVALVAGGLGVIGRALVDELAGRDEWEVVALSRRVPDFDTPARYLCIDLLDPAQCAERLRGLRDTTHLFYCALSSGPGAWDRPANQRMLVNLVEAIDAASPNLTHVSLMQGSSYYGFHSPGGGTTPAREDDPRTTAPNFYYTQEDYLRERAERANWTWSAPRPGAVAGFAVGNPMNLTLVIALYAVISRELGLALRFPGGAEAYERLFEVTDAGLLARATAWVSETPACAGEAINVTNADCFRWCDLWPEFADWFAMDRASAQPISLAAAMADKGALWQSMVERYDLQPYGLEALAGWAFGDEEFNVDHDMVSSNVKRFRLGFSEAMDSAAMFRRQFESLRDARVIP
jgi:nucleoside-diphosphate-sugar epimerase